MRSSPTSLLQSSAVNSDLMLNIGRIPITLAMIYGLIGGGTADRLVLMKGSEDEEVRDPPGERLSTWRGWDCGEREPGIISIGTRGARLEV